MYIKSKYGVGDQNSLIFCGYNLWMVPFSPLRLARAAPPPLLAGQPLRAPPAKGKINIEAMEYYILFFILLGSCVRNSEDI